MSSIVFVTWDGGGNVPPAVGIGRELVRRGHDVRFLGHPSQAEHFAERGLSFAPFASCVPFTAVGGAGSGQMLKVFSDRAMGASVVREVQRTSPDLVVVDCLLLGVMDELRTSGIPYAVLEHSLDGHWRKAAKGPLGLLMRLRGLRMLQLIDGGRARICTSIPELDEAGRDVIHTGAVVTGVPATPTTPTLLVSLTTLGLPSLPKRWATVLAAVDGLDVRVIATTGPAIDPRSLKAPRNVEVHGYVPHAEVMPTVSAVLGHGGHATTMAALAHGVPVVVVPVDSKTDQPYIAAAITRAGVGLAPKRRVAAIRAAVEQVLTDPVIRSNAAAMGERIRSNAGDAGGADALERLLALTPVAE